MIANDILHVCAGWQGRRNQPGCVVPDASVAVSASNGYFGKTNPCKWEEAFTRDTVYNTHVHVRGPSCSVFQCYVYVFYFLPLPQNAVGRKEIDPCEPVDREGAPSSEEIQSQQNLHRLLKRVLGDFLVTIWATAFHRYPSKMSLIHIDRHSLSPARIQCIKNLMSKFLLEELPDLPQANHQEDVPNAAIDAGSIPTAATTPTPIPTEAASDGKESDAVVCGERASSNPSHPRRLNAGGKAPVAAGGGSEGGGSGGGSGSGSSSCSDASNASSGRAGYPSGSGGSSGGGGGSIFCDEASAGSAGLVISSPVDLEPILLPASSSLSAASTAFDVAPSEKGAAGLSAPTAMGTASGSGGTASGPYAPVGQGVLPSRYPSGSGDDRLWLVYDGVSAAGKGVISKVNAPDPYWLGRASPGVVCPHAHSMEFHSSFESANLLRAVQVQAALLLSSGHVCTFAKACGLPLCTRFAAFVLQVMWGGGEGGYSLPCLAVVV